MCYAFSPNVRDAIRASDKRIVITGSGGWLGLATLELLADALGDALPSQVHCFGSAPRALNLTSGVTIQQDALASITDLPTRPTLLLHLAFLTKDRAEDMTEADYRSANRGLSQIVLDALDGIGTEAVFVASSGAARFADDPAKPAAMRLYGELKRADEQAFAAWAETRNRRAVITRIFNIAGPHINKQHSYALSAFILDALAGRAITVRAPHRVVRGYVAIRELMSLVFALLLEPASTIIRFDTGGEPMELEQLARAVATEYHSQVVRAPLSSDRDDTYVGHRDAYDDLLAGHCVETVPIAQQITETGSFLASTAGIRRVGGSRSA